VQITREGKDRFGRTLALVRVNGQDAGQIMIGHHLAVPWAGRRHEWCGRMVD